MVKVWPVLQESLFLELLGSDPDVHVPELSVWLPVPAKVSVPAQAVDWDYRECQERRFCGFTA